MQNGESRMKKKSHRDHREHRGLQLIASFFLLALSAQAQIISVGETETVRASSDGVLTNVFQYTRPVHFDRFNNVLMRMKVLTPHGIQTNSFKTQWAPDNSNWVDEVTLDAGTISAGEQPYTPNVRIVQFAVTNGVTYGERFNRLMPWVRWGFRNDTAVSTGRIEVIAIPFNN